MSVRMWRIATAVGVVAILLATWFLLVGPQRTKAAELEVETASQQAASQQLESRISLLKKQSEELPAQEAKLAAIQQRIPATASIPTLIRTLSGLASGANVSVTALDPARPAPIVIAVPEPVATEAPDDQAADDTEEAADESDDVGEPVSEPAEPTVQAVGLSIAVCGDFAQIRNYLGELESMRRVVAVSGLSIGKATCGKSQAESLQAQITASAFTMPPADAATTEVAAAATGTNSATTEAS
jgi:Tfp pilus assembly protein PilO